MTTTSSFQKYPDYYNTVEECNLFSKNYNKEVSNPRYKNFKQVHFTAGDEEQFQKYICDKNGDETPVEINKDNLFCDNTLFLEWDKYKNLDNLSRINTFKYMFEKFKKGVYVKILNNKLEVFLPFSNANFVNEWSHKIKVDPKYENITEFFKHISELEGYSFNKNYINNYIGSWYSNNCLLRYEYPVNEGDTNISAIKNMLSELCENRKLPDMEFFINRRDFPVLSREGYEPYYHIWDSLTQPLLSHNYEKYLPILSMSGNENFSDVLMPTYEDWIRVQSKENKYFVKARQVYDNKISELSWKNKKPTAVFRGSSTGEGITIETNQRLKVAHLSHITNNKDDNIYPPYLDAGITKWNLRPKKLMGSEYLQIIDINNMPFGLVEKLTPFQQSEYKYIIHIDGHVSAFRLSYQLSLNSVILLVKSKWNVWYSNMLIPYVHYIPVKEDLSDLIEQIEWCRNNDKKCENIVYNAKCFYNNYLQKDSIFDYLQKLFVDIKKTTGIYFNNFSSVLDNQIEYQSDFMLNKKYISNVDINKNINDINSLPHNKRTYPLLCALQKLLHFLNFRSCLQDKFIGDNIIFNNKLSTIRKVEYLGYDFIVKSTTNLDKIKEHTHEAFICINMINNLSKIIPNFGYTFDFYKTKESPYSFNIISEYVSNQTFQSYIMSDTFEFSVFLNILIQLCLALEVAQENCCFVHNDLTPWNICLKYLNEPTYIDYKIKNKVISIKTSVIPIIIDYGRSHVIYNNQHYGFINMFKFTKSFDMLTLFVTCVYQVISSKLLSKKDFVLFLKLTNFISNTKYCDTYFRNSKEVKTFFYSAKKYANLLNSNKYEIDTYTPLKLFNYIVTDLNYSQHVRYSNTFNDYMNIGNSVQIFNYIFSSSIKDKIKSFTNVFKAVKKIDLTGIHPLFLITITNTLKKSVSDTCMELKLFCEKENIKNTLIYNNQVKEVVTYLDSIKIDFKNIYIDFDIKYQNLINEVITYDEKIFTDLERVKTYLFKNKNIKDASDMDFLSLLVSIHSTIEDIYLNLPNKINKKYFENKFENIQTLNKSDLLNKIANLYSLKNHSKILYKKNIDNINPDSGIAHLNYYNKLNDILNICDL